VVWILVAVVVVLSLLALAVALWKAYRAGRALAREVGRASAGLEPLSKLQVGEPAAAAAPADDALWAREAALAEREAAVTRREKELAAAARTAPDRGSTSWAPRHRA